MAGDKGPKHIAESLHGKLERLQQLALVQGGGEETRSVADPFQAVLSEEPTAYAARLFAQLYLPYRDPGDLASWSRTNGAVTLTIRPGQWLGRDGTLCHGYPYGALPRLIITWMTGEVLRTEQRSLEAGASLYEFLGRIGLNPATDDGRQWRTGGHDARRLSEQMYRLFTASFTVIDAREPESWGWGIFSVTDSGSSSRTSAWGTKITVSERFFEAIMSGCVPLEAKALRALRGSPLRLDIYTWLAHRLGYLKKPTTVPWSALAAQFGGEYDRTRDFKRQFLRQLAAVQKDAYPAARVEPAEAGLVLRPSKPAVPRRRHTPASGG